MSANFRSVLSLALSAALVVWGAAPIGIVKTAGEFRLGGANVRANGTLFAGDTVESTAARADLILNNGTQWMLAPDSRSQVFESRAVLERGIGELRSASAYTIEAGKFRVSLAGGGAQVVFAPRTGHLRVAVLTGDVAVRNAGGMLLARVMPGSAMDFEPQAGAAATVQLKGKLEKVNGKYLLTDQTTGVTVELQGADLDKYVGKVVLVTGSSMPGATPAPGATQVVSVTTISLPTHRRLPAGAWIAIIGGAAVGSTVGGLYATGVLGAPAAPASRP